MAGGREERGDADLLPGTKEGWTACTVASGSTCGLTHPTAPPGSRMTFQLRPPAPAPGASHASLLPLLILTLV